MPEAKIQQWATMTRRTFRALFYDMEIFLTKSEDLYKLVHAQDVSNPAKLDMGLWSREKAYSRASFITGMAALEAFCNTLVVDFKCHEIADLPDKWMNHDQRQRTFDRWRLASKIRFVPVICNGKLKSPSEYFDQDSDEIVLLTELSRIRNSIMHGRIQKPKILITYGKNRIHIVDDEFPENFWKKSKIPYDFTTFNYECARDACRNIGWFKNKLIEFIGSRISNSYLRDDQVQCLGARFESNE
jgi:hypothetical protein